MSSSRKEDYKNDKNQSIIDFVFEVFKADFDLYNYESCDLVKIDGGFEIQLRRMYDGDLPGPTLERLMRLADFFGTTSIDVDNYAQGGCETCDYGSSYGFDLQVRGATKNIPEV